MRSSVAGTCGRQGGRFPCDRFGSSLPSPQCDPPGHRCASAAEPQPSLPPDCTPRSNASLTRQDSLPVFVHEATVLGSMPSTDAAPLFPFFRTRSCSSATSRRWWTSSTLPPSSITGSTFLMLPPLLCNLHRPIGGLCTRPTLFPGTQPAIFQLRPLHAHRGGNPGTRLLASI